MGIGAIIWWIVIGLIAGALAKLIMPGDDPGGFIVTIILGILGAFVGGFLAGLIGIGGGGTIWTIIIATIGAIILLAIYRAVAGGRTARR
ncbi:MAG: GlsB/YeaQ/YmgE family stress response membrane protein [Actinomycetota bacterium]|nr:GlsB/YeaQ/YmgE family stress response membrane protein [Actinomycetota bacterium]